MGEIKIGDKVRIRKDCTIGELAEDKWNKAHYDTLEFLEDEAVMDNVYVVTGISEKRRNAVITTEYGKELYVNYKLLEVVERKPKVERCIEKLLTDVAEAFGYEIELNKNED